MNINIEIFKRYAPGKKLRIIKGLSDLELLAISIETVTRIIKEEGSNFYKSRDKRLHVSPKFKTGNNWDSTFTGVELIKGKLYVSLYVQYSNTDTEVAEAYAKFFSMGEYRGFVHYEDRYGNPQTDYFTYSQSDKARAIKSLLLEYVQRKYNLNDNGSKE